MLNTMTSSLFQAASCILWQQSWKAKKVLAFLTRKQNVYLFKSKNNFCTILQFVGQNAIIMILTFQIKIFQEFLKMTQLVARHFIYLLTGTLTHSHNRL